MNENFIRKRITELREKKNISEYKMSLDLGHSKSYIQSITSGRALPSMNEFLYICEYLEVTPEVFFRKDINEPILYQKIMSEILQMDENDLNALLVLIQKINKSND